MNRKVFLAAALFIALGMIGLLGQPATTQGPEGAVMTGVWYWQNVFGPGVLPSILTFHNDGTVLCSDALAFGGIPDNPFTLTPLYGVWERTGPQEYTATWLCLCFYRTAPLGMLAGIVRSRANFAFAGDFDHIAGTMSVDLLLSDYTSDLFPLNCPDPLAPDAAWASWTTLNFTAARVSVVPY
jgi:hypothetical protein